MSIPNTKGLQAVRFIAVTFTAMAFLGHPSMLFAQSFDDRDYVQELSANGGTNWTKGVVTATGIGVPSPEATNAFHARAMAKRAALVVAYRNLLEIVQGIRVDSVTTVNNYMVQNDEIKTKVQGFVKGAKIIDEKEMADGSFQITVEMPLTGELPAAIIPKRSSRPVPLTFDSTRIYTQSPVEKGQSGVYTGLVINAKGLGAKPALNPKIYMEDGRVAYGASWVDPQAFDEKGIVGYVHGEDEAKSNFRVTQDPLLIRALQVKGENQTDLVISDADAQLLHLEPKNLEFLEKGRVLVVLE